MTMLRGRRQQKKYQQYLATRSGKQCEFCTFNKKNSQFVSSTKYFKIIRNIFEYQIWDSCGVTDQFMLIPKKHCVSLSEFTKAELLDFTKQVLAFEAKGYSVYLRAPTAITKSVIHQHTHFIKLDNKRKKTVLYLKKPHILLHH